MRRLTLFALSCALTCTALAQQGGGMVQREANAVRALERDLATYLDGPEQRMILTPGETGDWPIKLEVGQVVVAEARSDAFDPALEIADPAGKALSPNDDRYPGDQRPLLLWRCEKAGDYALRIRCVRDKSGGLAFVRFKVYDSIDLASDKPTERAFGKPTKFLMRVPMKAGQIKQLVFDTAGNRFDSPVLRATASPVGLPYTSLTQPIEGVVSQAILAPVDGDYYVVGEFGGDGPRCTVRASTRDIVPAELARPNGKGTAQAPGNAPSLWVLPVKQGEFIQVSTPDLNGSAQIVLAEEPTVTQYDLKKPDANPFYPQVADKARATSDAITVLPGRDMDPRIVVFVARKDARLWLATNGAGAKGKEFALSTQPAAADYAASGTLKGALRIGSNDYWAFNAKAGDVMSLKAVAKGFAGRVQVLDPDLRETSQMEAGLDQTEFPWNMIIQRPGRYLVAVSCKGDGGGGEYTLTRQVFPPKEFSKGAPAKDDIANGQTQVWKFTAKPGEPLYIHWWSSSRTYAISARNENGDGIGFPLTDVSGNDSYGIINVSQPTTFLLVLTSTGDKAQYSIELTDLPGFGNKK
jgi:hypothetical protein